MDKNKIVSKMNEYKEIEVLKKDDDIAIDWDKVELEEVDDDE